MGESSKIQWTTHTFNPWWGCARVSPACENCYAETFAKRAGFGPHPVDPKKLPLWGVDASRRFFGAKHWREPLKWNARAEGLGVRERVFCASMADVFEELPERQVALREEMRIERYRLWGLIEETRSLDWLLLTKRPQNIARMVPPSWMTDGFPLNVWVGVTAEDQKRADERVPILFDIPAAIRFVSYEPALELVDFSKWIVPLNHRFELAKTSSSGHVTMHPRRPLDWIIVGGESGHGARDFDVYWAREVIRATRGSRTSAFVKQLGSKPTNGRLGGDGDDCYEPVRYRLADRAGGDWLEWPEDLRVREIPIPFAHRHHRIGEPDPDRLVLSP